MKYVNQLDYPYVVYQTNTDDPTDLRRSHGTFAMSGCGLASAVMVADRLLEGCGFGVFDAVALSYESGANHAIGTDYAVYAPAFAEKLGLEFRETNDTDEVRNCLRTGGAVVALSTGDRPDGHVGLFTHGAHFITLIYELRDGRVAILDPSLKAGKYDEEGRKDRAQVDGHLVYAALEDVREDFDVETNLKRGSAETTAFWCFWKKI